MTDKVPENETSQLLADQSPDTGEEGGSMITINHIMIGVGVLVGFVIIYGVYTYFSNDEQADDKQADDKQAGGELDSNIDMGSDIDSNTDLFTGGEPLPRCTLYYVNWCGHCKNLKPVWNELQKKEKYNDKIEFEEVEGDEHPEVVQKEQIEGYPTIKLHKNSETIEYQGNRSIEDLEKFVDDNL